MKASKCSIPFLWIAICMTLCGISRAKAPLPCTDRPTMQKLYLELHNSLRQRVGAPVLVWNDTLADRAQKLTADRRDCRNPPSYEPDVNFFFCPKMNNEVALRGYYNSMDWESYGYDPETQSCPDSYPCDGFQKIARLNVTSIGCCDNPCEGKGTLILCYFSPLLVDRSGISQGGPVIAPQKYVDGINELRVRKQMPPLVWDEGLGQKARMFTDARKAPMGCKGIRKRKFGMDQYVYFSPKDDNPDKALVNMLNAIDWEGYAYDAEKQTCPDGMECENFKRIASPETQRLGCSEIQCIGCAGSLITCYFDPPAKQC